MYLNPFLKFFFKIISFVNLRTDKHNCQAIPYQIDNGSLYDVLTREEKNTSVAALLKSLNKTDNMTQRLIYHLYGPSWLMVWHRKNIDNYIE